MADIGVFSRYKGFNEFQQEAEKNNLAKALGMAKIQAAQSELAKDASGANLPAALQLANEYQARIKAGDLEGANTIAAFAKTTDKGLVMGPDGNYYVAGGYAPAVGEIAQAKGYGQQLGKDTVQMQTAGPIAAAKANAANASDMEYKPGIAFETGLAKTRAEKESNKPKAYSSLNAALASSKIVQDKIDSLLPRVSGSTTGFVGSATKRIPGTPSADFAADLQTIKANLGFDRLQEMRDNSKTGGALGSIAVQELQALQSTYSNLEQSQSPEQFANNLRELQQIKRASDIRIQDAFKRDYGVPNADGSASLDSLLADPIGMDGDPVDNSNMGANLPKPATVGDKKREFNARKAAKSGLTPEEYDELQALRKRFKK